jgi:hypothetical protein
MSQGEERAPEAPNQNMAVAGKTVAPTARLLALAMVGCFALLSVWFSGQWLWSRALGSQGAFWSTAAAALFQPDAIWKVCFMSLMANFSLGMAALAPAQVGRAPVLAWAGCAVLGIQTGSACLLELSATPESMGLWIGVALGAAVAIVAALRARAAQRRAAPLAKLGSLSVGVCVIFCVACVAMATTASIEARSIDADASEAIGKAMSWSIKGAQSAREREGQERAAKLDLWEAQVSSGKGAEPSDSGQAHATKK